MEKLVVISVRMPNENVLHAVVKDNKILCSGESTCEITYSEGTINVEGHGVLFDCEAEITCPKCVSILNETEKPELQYGCVCIPAPPDSDSFGFSIPISEGTEAHPNWINGVKSGDSLRFSNGQWVKIE